MFVTGNAAIVFVGSYWRCCAWAVLARLDLGPFCSAFCSLLVFCECTCELLWRLRPGSSGIVHWCTLPSESPVVRYESCGG